MASRILFITDTHFGGNATGFQQQPRRVDLLPQVWTGLRKYLKTNPVDLVVHGGDLVDNGAAAEMKTALQFLGELGAPVAYCLGNHDLGTPAGFERWRTAPHPANVRSADCLVALADVDVLLMSNAWLTEAGVGMFWKVGVDWQERVLPATREWLETTLAGQPERPAVLVVHSPLNPIPPRLTGLAKPIHPVFADYATMWAELLARYPRVKLVLSGHNHVTMATRQNDQLRLTTSALCEPPFEFRVIEFTAHSLQVETRPAIELPPAVVYDRQRAWVNGQAADRTLTLRW